MGEFARRYVINDVVGGTYSVVILFGLMLLVIDTLLLNYFSLNFIRFGSDV